MKALLILAGLIVVTLSAPYHQRQYRHDVISDKDEDHFTAEDNNATFTDLDSIVSEDMMDHAAEDADAAVEGDSKEVTEVEEEDDEGDHSEDAMDNAEEMAVNDEKEVKDEAEYAMENAEEMAVNDEKEVEDEAEDADMSSGDAEDVPAADASSDEEAAEMDTVVEAPDRTDETSQMEEVVTTSDNGGVGGDVTVAVSKSEGDGAVTKTFTTSVKSKLKGSGSNHVSSVSAFLEGTFDDKIIDLTSVKNEVDQTVE